MRGSPIRKSSDQRSVDSSPRLIAASYVLHRLLVPRHPPCALNNLATQKSHPTHPRKEAMRRAYKNSSLKESEDARVHCAVLNVRPDTHHMTPPAPHTPAGVVAVRDAGRPCQKQRLPAPSGPNSAPTTEPTPELRSTPTPRGRQYWEPADASRPNWSAFHPRAPPQEHAIPRE